MTALILGWFATDFVLLTFYPQTIASLQLVAIFSHLNFIGYAVLIGATPIFVLRSICIATPNYRLLSVPRFPIAILCLLASLWAHAEDPKSNGLRAACESNLPVLVIDNFPKQRNEPSDRMRVIDLDGDGIADIFHGELVESLVKISGRKTERLNMDGVLSISEVHDLLRPVVETLENGTKSYSWINFSQEFPLKLSALKTDVFPNDGIFPEVTSANVKSLSSRILKKLAADRPDLRIEETADLFSRLEKLNVLVIVAAGNFGPGFVNFFSLLKSVTSVGSLEINGNKLQTSADNSLVSIWRSGVVVPVVTADGMDLDDDGRADFKTNVLSGGPAIVGNIIGRNVNEAVVPVSDEFLTWIERAARTDQLVLNAAVNVVDDGLYEVSNLVILPTVTAGTAQLFRSLGQYALKLKDGPPRYFFKVDASGRLVFDPSGTGKPNQRTRIGGTSFASPRVCLDL